MYIEAPEVMVVVTPAGLGMQPAASFTVEVRDMSRPLGDRTAVVQQFPGEGGSAAPLALARNLRANLPLVLDAVFSAR